MALTRTFMSFYLIKAARGIVNHPKPDPIVAHTKVDGPLFIPKVLPTQPPALGSPQFNSKQVFRTLPLSLITYVCLPPPYLFLFSPHFVPFVFVPDVPMRVI